MTDLMKALIFDVDGTLAETEELHRQSFNAAFKEFDLPWHWDQALYKELLEVTGGKERLKHYAALSNYGPIDEVTIHKRKTAIYTETMMAGGIQLRPGVEATIRRAKAAGLRLAIATTTSRINVDTLLTATLGTEAIQWFDAMACGDEVSAKKPDPALYELALQKLGLKGEECIAVEDSWLGLASATGARIPTIITPSAYTEDHDFSGALAVLPTLEKLVSQLDEGRLPSELEAFSGLS